jgi:hypothetical protein
MNEELLKNNFIYYDITYKDSATVNGIKKVLSRYRLSGAQSCGISTADKYSHIYIEDGFHDEEGFYNGIVIVDNENVCEITTSPYKLRIDSLSYTKGKGKDIAYNEVVFYTKKIFMNDFKEKYLNEYYRYKLVTQNKVNDLKKCYSIDSNTPKTNIYAKNYYFGDKKINVYNLIEINYGDIKDGVVGLPYFREEKKKEFMRCIESLNVLIE